MISGILAQPKDDASVEDVAWGVAAEYFKTKGANSASLALGVGEWALCGS